MNVEEIMSKHPVCCTPDSTLFAVARLMVEHDCGVVPVVKNQQTRVLVGILTDRDITCRAVARAEHPQRVVAGECMSYPVFTVHPETSLEECCRIMEHNRIRRVVVVDSERACVGIVSLADIAMWAPNLLTAEVIRAVSQPPRTATRFPIRA
ncbi:MAG TPA: CBS domain-containing protein [Chthonomonadaceae bacterium]|nr:CBS domain-containing protein [Chthonomonadaceae bacterium]